MAKSEQLKKKIKDAEKQIDKLKNQLVKYSEKLFYATCKDIFKKHKDFTSFAWSQYTPYWNDGDQTVFSANTDDIYIDQEEETETIYRLNELFKDLKNKDKKIKELKKEIEDGKLSDWQIKANENRIEEINNSDIDKVEKRLLFMEDVCDLLNSINQESLENMFGDHVKVVVTENGVDIESYEHD